MKWILLIVNILYVFCGWAFAQQNESHWPDFDYHDYGSHSVIVAFVQIDGDFIAAEDSWADIEVAAFVDGVCRGHEFMIDETNMGDPYPTLQLSIFYDIGNAGEDVTFKLYDHLAGIEYEDCACNYDIHTGEEHFEAWLDPEASMVMNFGDVHSHRLYSGWNWWSTNLEVTMDQLKAALVDALGPNASITIQSQTQSTTFKRGRWVGQLTSLDVTQMYVIVVDADCEIYLEGTPVNPAEHPITIVNGANWIAFPFGESMTIDNAMTGFPSVNGDIIQSQTNNCVYNRGTWRGAVSTLDTGKGYIFQSNTQEVRTLTLPAKTK